MKKSSDKNKGMKDVTVYTDGSCLGNPGPGGYAAILKYGSITKEIHGCEEFTTNNRMEMLAVVKALSILKRPCRISLFTDSMYLKKGFTEWLPKWRMNSWQTADKRQVKNKDLWEKLIELCTIHQVEWQWVRGHASDPLNERCDRLAREAIEECL